jgi:hypothetical protein
MALVVESDEAPSSTRPVLHTRVAAWRVLSIIDAQLKTESPAEFLGSTGLCLGARDRDQLALKPVDLWAL